MQPHEHSENRGRLLDSEWIVVGSLILIMASLIIIGQINAARSSSLLEMHPTPSHELCTIVIEGEVSKPGTFKVLPGTILKKILLKSSPTPFADLKKIDLEQRVEESMNIYIETLIEITITMRGLYSDPVQRRVPAGTRVCHLKNFVPDDLSFFKNSLKSRRFLKDLEEIVLVPDFS
jgi:hypothetical protein